MNRIIWDPVAVLHMWDRHGVSPAEAEEALSDPEALMQSPDPASRSKKSDRYIGWSSSRGEVLVVIVIRHHDQLFGGNAWAANSTQRALYEGRRNNG